MGPGLLSRGASRDGEGDFLPIRDHFPIFCFAALLGFVANVASSSLLGGRYGHQQNSGTRGWSSSALAMGEEVTASRRSATRSASSSSAVVHLQAHGDEPAAFPKRGGRRGGRGRRGVGAGASEVVSSPGCRAPCCAPPMLEPCVLGFAAASTARAFEVTLHERNRMGARHRASVAHPPRRPSPSGSGLAISSSVAPSS